MFRCTFPQTKPSNGVYAIAHGLRFNASTTEELFLKIDSYEAKHEHEYLTPASYIVNEA